MKDRTVFILAARDCIQSIESYLNNYDLDAFLADKKTQDAVIRNLEVLGQAVKDYGIEALKQDYPEIPWLQVTGMRNVLAHEYLGLDLHIIWEAATNHLSPLKAVIETILAQKDT